MNVDHYFTIGSSHLSQGSPCEDYATSGRLPDGRIFGVVSDGCSGSKGDTDIGARVLSHAFKTAAAGATARDTAHLFSLRLNLALKAYRYTPDFADYLATVVGFFGTQDEIWVYAQGDGAIGIAREDGSHELVQLQWQNNLPLYAGYSLADETLQDFRQAHASCSTPFLVRKIRQGLDASQEPVLVEEFFAMEEASQGYFYRLRPREEGITALFVATDGIEQVGSLSSREVAKELLAFKNHRGEFLKRRAMRALQGFHKAGMTPCDDLAIASVTFKGEDA